MIEYRSILFRNWRVRSYAILAFVSLILTLSGFFVAGKGIAHVYGSTKLEGLIKQKYPCKPEDRCQEPWEYNFDIEINQILHNFRVDLDTYQKHKLGDKYIVIQKAGEKWFLPYDFFLEQLGWGALGAVLLIFFGGWGFSFFGAVVLKSERLNFIHDICAATFYALVGFGGMYMACTDIYTIHSGKQYEATILTKDIKRRTGRADHYSFDVKVDELNKQFHGIYVGHDFYDEHELGEKVVVLLNTYSNSLIIHGGMAYYYVLVGLFLMFFGWLGVFNKHPKYLERRFPSKFSRQLDSPKVITSTRASHKEFDLELYTVLGEVNETYKKGYKDFCIDIAQGSNNILQIVSPYMFDALQKDEMGFVVYATFDEKDDKKKEFLKIPIAKEFVYSDMGEGVDCYWLNLNNDQVRVVALIKEFLLKVWGIQPKDCNVSWWASEGSSS